MYNVWKCTKIIYREYTHVHGPVNGCFTAYYIQHNHVKMGVIHEANPDPIQLYLPAVHGTVFAPRIYYENYSD